MLKNNSKKDKLKLLQKNSVDTDNISELSITNFAELNKNLCHSIPFLITNSVINKKENSFTAYSPDGVIKMRMEAPMSYKLPNMKTDGIIFLGLITMMRKCDKGTLAFNNLNELVDKLGPELKYLRKKRILQALNSLAFTTITFKKYYLPEEMRRKFKKPEQYIQISMHLIDELTIAKDDNDNDIKYYITLSNRFNRYANPKLGYKVRARVKKMMQLERPLAMKLCLLFSALEEEVRISRDIHKLSAQLGLQTKNIKINKLFRNYTEALIELESKKTEFLYNPELEKKGGGKYNIVFTKLSNLKTIR